MQIGNCPNDGGCLFDVPNFEAFSEKRPIILTCRHCGQEYQIVHKGDLILYRQKGQPATQNIEAEQYG